MSKVVRIFGWIAAAVVALIIIAVVGLLLFFPVEKAKQLVVEKASAQTGREISIGDASVSFWGGLGVKLGDVAVGNPAEFEEGDFLKAENVDVKLRILPLLSGNYRVDRLVINNPEINMHKRVDGSNNYTFKAAEEKAPPELVEKATPEAKAAAVAVTFDRLVINNGLLSYVDDSSQTSFTLEGLDLATSLASPRTNYYQSSGEISVRSVQVKTEKPLPPLSLKLDYIADYDADSGFLSFDNTELEINNLRFGLKGELTDLAGDTKARATIKSQKITVADLFKLIPEKQLEATKDLKISGDFSLDLDIEYDANKPETLLYFGTAEIVSMNLSHKEVPGELEFAKAMVDFKNNNLRFTIADAYFDGKPIKGHMVVDNFDDPVVNGEFQGGLNLAYVQPFLPAVDSHVVKGLAEFDIKLSGKTQDFTAMTFSGDLKVVGGSYSSLLLVEPVESFDLDVYFDNRVTNVKKLDAKTKSGNVAFVGRFNDLVPYFMADSVVRKSIAPTIDGSMKGNLNLAVVNTFLPPEGKPELKGDLGVDIKLSGVLTQYDKLRPSGSVSIKNASYTDSLLPEPITHFEAEMAITPDTINIKNLTAKFVSSDATFSGKLADPFPYLLPFEGVDRTQAKKPMFLFRLTSHRFDTDKLFPEAVPGSGENRAGVPVDSLSPVILPDIDGQGTFQADTVIYCKVELSNLVGKIKIYDRKIECYDVTGKVYTGDISGTTIIDLNDFERPVYTGEFKAANVEANDFLSRFTKFGGHLFGKVNFDGNYSAAGWEPEDFLNSLTMNSVSSMKQGKMVTSGVVLSAFTELSQRVGQSFDKEQPIKDLLTNVTVKDGKVSFDTFKTKLGNIGDLELGGYYSFTNDIDGNGSILLSEEYSKKLVSKLGSGLGGLLTDRSVNRVKLGFPVGGTIDNPSFGIDYSQLTKNLKDNLEEDAANKLLDLFKKK